MSKKYIPKYYISTFNNLKHISSFMRLQEVSIGGYPNMSVFYDTVAPESDYTLDIRGEFCSFDDPMMVLYQCGKDYVWMSYNTVRDFIYHAVCEATIVICGDLNPLSYDPTKQKVEKLQDNIEYYQFHVSTIITGHTQSGFLKYMNFVISQTDKKKDSILNVKHDDPYVAYIARRSLGHDKPEIICNCPFDAGYFETYYSKQNRGT